MTTINKSLANHGQIVESLHRLNTTIVRMLNPRTDNEIIDIFNAFYDDNNQSIKKTIKEIDTSGDLPRVSEELYNPSSDIFDDDINTPYWAKPNSVDSGYEGFEEPIDDDIGCTAKYLIKHDSKIYAKIKNYHTLQYIDHSGSSLVYPLNSIDSIQVTSARVYSIQFPNINNTDELISIAFNSSLSFPQILKDRYVTEEKLTSSFAFISAAYVSFTKKVTTEEYLKSTAKIYDIILDNNRIEYSMEPESLESTAAIYEITRP